MTEKKDIGSRQESSKEKTPTFEVEGVDQDLLNEALAAVEKPTSSAEDKAATDEEDEILWEEPEVMATDTSKSAPADKSAPAEVEAEASSASDLSALRAELEQLKIAQKELEEQRDEALKEKAELYEKFVRLSAEFDNFRKRTQREKEELKRFGHRDASLDLLDVLDNFSRALETLTDADSSIREGIEMVHRQLLDILARHGIKRFNSVGEPFDYTRHQAISVFETDEYPPQIVHEVFKDGYMIHDQLLRPAMVIVTKAKPTAPKEQPKVADGDSEEDAASRGPSAPETEDSAETDAPQNANAASERAEVSEDSVSG